ncbi:MAG: hypothetical protein GXP44_02850 [bacterium]|nr:hypothetical protein [bacterium]
MKNQLVTKSSSIVLLFVFFLLPVSASANTNTITPIPITSPNLTSVAYRIDADSSLSNAVNAAKFGFGVNSKFTSDTRVPLSATGAAAVITIFADATSDGSGSSGGSGFGFGTHAFITVKNVSSGNIQVGKFSNIAPGKTMSLGTWGNKSEHTGLWYNLESYFIQSYGYYSNRVSTSYIMTASELANLNSYIINNDYWSLLTNCSSFAASAWNSAVDPSYSLSAGTPNTPSNLADNLMAKFPGYQTGAAVPWDYIVYYAQGTGTPIPSSIYN